MGTRLAFIRGINVGGNNALPMAGLRGLLDDLGFVDARTYIQSGNIVYDPPAATGDTLAELDREAGTITAAIEAAYGFAPIVMVRSAEAVAAAYASSPFAGADPAQSFLVFHAGDAAALGDLDSAATAGEQWRTGEGVVHLHCPNGAGRSKLAAKLASSKSVPTTSRNLRTIAKMLDLADSDRTSGAP